MFVTLSLFFKDVECEFLAMLYFKHMSDFVNSLLSSSLITVILKAMEWEASSRFAGPCVGMLTVVRKVIQLRTRQQQKNFSNCVVILNHL